QVVQKREAIEQTLVQLNTLAFTSSRLVEACAQKAGIAPLGQLMSARELLRRPEVRYPQVMQLSRRVEEERHAVTGTLKVDGATDALPTLPEETADEVELQVKYESYVRKQEQMVHRTQRLEEMRIPETIDYQQIQHLRTEARQKLARTRPRTVGQASRVEGVTPADTAILMIYVEKIRVVRASS
ncbi:MAG TPA: tRNA uridine-5-carboxymethylaminomethyl(34) synthesis enzyme MnmG, partial [Ktedonosporobacter sp.]|nr:tRNA uridine-5-carboxymethylaminomethyl(34) synthesis enzyme MnmG [Ktedonosporobacter sp.]